MPRPLPVRERELVVTRGAAEALRRGHPWVWRDGVVRGLRDVAPGGIATVSDPEGQRVGTGVADPSSPIAARMWVLGEAPLDLAQVGRRIDEAFARRARWFDDGATTAYRLLHGEGDRVPGFVVDRYGEVAVLRLDGKGAEAFAETVVPLLVRALATLGVGTLLRRVPREEPAAFRPAADSGARELSVLAGDLPRPLVEVREHGVPFVVDLAHGQKTGAFLDQRENRARVGALVARTRPRHGDRTIRVLNLFSYAGGFSQRAALAGGTVTSVDIAGRAHATAQASFKLAGISGDHEFVTADVFAFLAEAKRKRRTWDVVISDPPSFAPSERALSRALAAYRSLHRACIEVLAEGGIFCAASCSSHVDEATFASTLDDAALGRHDLSLLEHFGAPVDHPTLAAWPEGRYLKFFVLG